MFDTIPSCMTEPYTYRFWLLRLGNAIISCNSTQGQYWYRYPGMNTALFSTPYSEPIGISRQGWHPEIRYNTPKSNWNGFASWSILELCWNRHAVLLKQRRFVSLVQPNRSKQSVERNDQRLWTVFQIYIFGGRSAAGVVKIVVP